MKKTILISFFILSIFLFVSCSKYGNGNTINEAEINNNPSDRYSNTGCTEIDSNENGCASGNSLLVVIDPGHGGYDPGAVGNGLYEKDIGLEVGLKLCNLLKKDGYNVLMTRDRDIFVDYDRRIEIANKNNAALFLSIHCDWFDDDRVSGTTTLYYPSRSLRKGNLIEIDYARIIQKELAESLETKSRKINDRPDLYVLKNANMPSVIVELAFISNKQDAALLKTKAFKDKAAKALSEGIKKSVAIIMNE